MAALEPPLTSRLLDSNTLSRTSLTILQARSCGIVMQRSTIYACTMHGCPAKIDSEHDSRHNPIKATLRLRNFKIPA